MKKIILAAIMSFQFQTSAQAGCGTQTECKETKNAKGELDGDQTCVNFYKKNIVLTRAHYKAGKLDGDFFCADDDGVPVQQAHYKMGELDGLNKEYDSNLKTWALEENYKMGKREGLSKHQTANGQIIKFFKNDKQYGYQINVDKQGKLVSKMGCQIDGSQKEASVCDAIPIPGFEKLLNASARAEQAKIKPVPDKETDERKYKSGKLQAQTFYEKGQKVEEKTYFEQGQIQSDVFFKKGFWAYKTTDFYQNGKVKDEVLESDAGGAMTSADIKTYHDNGQLESRGRRMIDEREYWGDGVYDGEIDSFNEKGEPKQIAFYKMGKAIGTWKSFSKKCDYETNYSDGDLQNETTYAKGTRDVLIKVEYMPDGSKKSEYKNLA